MRLSLKDAKVANMKILAILAEDIDSYLKIAKEAK
jgi:hypothetical protein